MRYLEKSFSAPAGPANINQREWDYATMTRVEFLRKYYPMLPKRWPDLDSPGCWMHGALCTKPTMHHLFKYHHPDSDPDLQNICVGGCVWPDERSSTVIADLSQ